MHTHTGAYSNKGAFLLCKTSNPGSNELLALNLVTSSNKEEALFERIARLVGCDWVCNCNSDGTNNALLGIVVGATDPSALARARAASGPFVWILAPGVGAQGGDLMQCLQAGLNREGSGMLIPVSRGISQAENPGLAAKELCEQINLARETVKEAAANSQRSSTDNEAIQQYQKDFIKFSLDQGVLKFGSFILKSGRTSPYFFNAGLFCSGAALFKLGKAYASTIMASPDL